MTAATKTETKMTTEDRAMEAAYRAYDRAVLDGEKNPDAFADAAYKRVISSDTSTPNEDAMKTLSTNAQHITADGIVSERGIKVVDNGDTITIGRTEHRKDDLILDRSGRIAHKYAGWEVVL